MQCKKSRKSLGIYSNYFAGSDSFAGTTPCKEDIRMSDQENSNNNNNQVEIAEKKIEGSDNKPCCHNKKIILAIIIGIFTLILCFGIIAKKEPPQNQRKVPESQYTTTKTIKHPIIGTWQHQDIPNHPEFKEWKITFNTDGTFTSYALKEENFSLENRFGKKGTFVIDKDTNILILIDVTKHKKTYDNEIEIKNEGGKDTLTFKKSTGEYMVSNTRFSPSGSKTYFTTFIKE